MTTVWARKFHSLVFKNIASYLIILTLIVVPLVLQYLKDVESHLSKTLKAQLTVAAERGIRMIDAEAVALVSNPHWIDSQEYSRLVQALGRIERDFSVDNAVLYRRTPDKRFGYIADSRKAFEIGQQVTLHDRFPETRAAANDAWESGQVGATRIFESGSQKWFQINMPIQSADQVIGILMLNKFATPIAEEIGRRQSQITVGVLAAVAGGIILLWFVTNKRLAPLRRLQDASGKIAAGHLGFEIPKIRDRSEIGGLYRSFRIMVEDLRENRSKIEEYNRTLERKIEERKRAGDALRAALDEVEQLKTRLQAENIYLRNEIQLDHNFEEIITQSDVMTEVLGKLQQVAATDTTVLILGESGTGKELLARAIHGASNRSGRPLVKVNCAALPANLIESELFGHEKGAFTGAIARKPGRFELAHNGTIFLDEIGDLPMDLQAKLLRVLQEGEFERLGSTETQHADARVIAATNRNLEKAIQAGEFRADLYYRLNVFPLVSPALRERSGDVPMLARHFVKKYSAKIGKDIERISKSTIDALQAYRWPGNVRELENVIERAVILSNGPTLRVEERLDLQPAESTEAAEQPQTIKEMEREMIRKTLESCGWTIEGENGAAAKLDMSASTLRRRVQAYGLKHSGD